MCEFDRMDSLGIALFVESKVILCILDSLEKDIYHYRHVLTFAELRKLVRCNSKELSDEKAIHAL